MKIVEADISKQSNVLEILRLILQPVVRFCMRRALGVQEVTEALRVALVDAAVDELKRNGKKVSISSICTMTGLHRRAVMRIHSGQELDISSTHFTTRVIGQWRRDASFQTKSGRPRVLSYGSPDSEFSLLVEKVSRELYPKTVLLELERLALVERTKSGLKLLSKGFKTGKDPQDAYRTYARDSTDLLLAIDENLSTTSGEMPHFHGDVIYDNISEANLEKIRTWLFKHSDAFHEKVDAYLARHDLDIEPNTDAEGGRRVALGMYIRFDPFH